MNHHKERYAKFLESEEWQAKRRLVIERNRIYYGGCCERCLENEGSEVHHLTYDFGWNCHIRHLKYLCRDCHRFIHRLSEYNPLPDFSLEELDQRFKDLWSKAQIIKAQDKEEDVLSYQELEKRVKAL